MVLLRRAFCVTLREKEQGLNVAASLWCVNQTSVHLSQMLRCSPFASLQKALDVKSVPMSFTINANNAQTTQQSTVSFVVFRKDQVCTTHPHAEAAQVSTFGISAIPAVKLHKAVEAVMY